MPGLEAQLKITAKDEAGAAFDQIKQQIGALDKSIATFDKLGVAAAKVGKSADPMIQSINRSTSALDAQKAAVSALSERLASSAGSAEEAASGQRALGEATAATTRILVAQGAEAARVAGKLVEAQQKAATGAKRAREESGLGKTAGVIGGQMGGLGGLLLAGEAVHAGVDMAKDAALLVEARLKVKENAKGDPTESPFAEGLAGDVAAKYPNITEAEALKIYIEVRGNSLDKQTGFVNQEKMRRNLMMVAKAQSAALVGGFELTPEDAQNLMKAVEGSGRADDPTALGKMFDSYIRAKQVFGSAISSDKIRDLVLNQKSSSFGIGEEEFFFQDIARVTEGNASRLGNETAQTMQTLLGGHAKMQTALWLEKLGLSSGHKKMGGGNAEIMGLHGRDTLQLNNIAWVNEFLVPALKAEGFLNDALLKKKADLIRKDSPGMAEDAIQERAMDAAIADAAMQSGARTTVTDLLTHSAVNAPLIKRETMAMKNASGVGAAADIGQNPIAAFAELTHSIENFGAVVVAPAVAKAGPILDELAHGVEALANAAAAVTKKHPDLTGDVGLGAGVAAAGWAGWKALRWLFGGDGKGAAGAEGAPAGVAAPAAEGWLSTLGRLGAAVLAPASLIFGAASGNAAVRDITRSQHPASDESVRAWAAALSAPTGAAVRTPWPNQIQDMARGARAEQEFRRDPEAARGRAMHDTGTKSTVVGVQGSAQVDQTLHLDVSVPAWLEAKLEELTNFNFSVPLAAPTGRMDSDAAPAHGIGHM